MFSHLNEKQNNTIVTSIDSYRGSAFILESALGAIIIGEKYGWRVLKLIHSPATYKKYEVILGLNFQDTCPERGPLAHKSLGLKIADRLNSFWAVATGKKKIKNKAEFDDGEALPKDYKNE